jgi:aconitase A
MNFLSSPTIVTAMAFSGKLSFNPTKDELITPDGGVFKFTPPKGETLPADGFTPGSSFSRFLYHILMMNIRQVVWTYTPKSIPSQCPKRQ